jgi:hypothetical protein
MTHEPFHTEDQARYRLEIVTDVTKEMLERAPELDELSDRCKLAITAAVFKATHRGLLRGVSSLSPALDLSIRDPSTGGTPVEPDPWAEVYGAGGGTDGA